MSVLTLLTTICFTFLFFLVPNSASIYSTSFLLSPKTALLLIYTSLLFIYYLILCLQSAVTHRQNQVPKQASIPSLSSPPSSSRSSSQRFPSNSNRTTFPFFQLNSLSFLLLLLITFGLFTFFLHPFSTSSHLSFISNPVLYLICFSLIILLLPALIKPKNSKNFLQFIAFFAILASLISIFNFIIWLYPHITLPFQLNSLLPSLLSPFQSTVLLFIAVISLFVLFLKKGKFNHFLLSSAFILSVVSLFASCLHLFSTFQTTSLPPFNPRLTFQNTFNALEQKTPNFAKEALSYQFSSHQINSELTHSGIVFAIDQDASQAQTQTQTHTPSSPSNGTNFSLSRFTSLLFGSLASPTPPSYQETYLQYRSAQDTYTSQVPASSSQSPLSSSGSLQSSFSLLTLTSLFGLAFGALVLITIFFAVSYFSTSLNPLRHSKNSSLRSFAHSSQDFLLALPPVALILFLIIPLDPLIIYVTALIIAVSFSYNQQFLRSFSSPGSLKKNFSFLLLLICGSAFIYLGFFNFRSSSLESAPSPRLDFIARYQSTVDWQNFLDQHATLQPTLNSQLPSSAQNSLTSAQTAVRLNPHHPYNWQQLGQAYSQLVSFSTDYLPLLQLSTNSYLEAFSRNPYDLQLCATIIDLFLHHLHLPDSALPFINHYLELQPQSSFIHQTLASYYLKTNQSALAYQELQTAIGLLDRESPNYQDNYQALQAHLLQINID